MKLYALSIHVPHDKLFKLHFLILKSKFALMSRSFVLLHSAAHSFLQRKLHGALTPFLSATREVRQVSEFSVYMSVRL